MRWRYVLLAAALTLTSPAASEIVTRCGASSGYAYRLRSPLVPDEKTGWISDEITDGEILLDVSKVDGKFAIDIIYKDAARMVAGSKEGFAYHALFGDDQFLVIGVNPETNVMEHYLFEIEKGVGRVVWGTARLSGPIRKSSLMEAECAAP